MSFSDAVNYAISLFVLGMALQTRAEAALFKGASMAPFGLWVIGNTGYKAVTGTVPDMPLSWGARASWRSSPTWATHTRLSRISKR